MKILLGAVLVLLVGSGIYFATRSDGSTPMAEPTVEQTDTETEPEAAAQTQAGAYVDYSDTVIASTKGTKVLFFHASWCPQCRALESSIKSSQIPDGVTIIKVDYDSHQKLRQQYGVTIQTTLVKVDDDGKLVEKYVAYDQPTFAAVKTNLL
jgi:thiol-disulfide isomerase/thioredoxin